MQGMEECVPKAVTQHIELRPAKRVGDYTSKLWVSLWLCAPLWHFSSTMKRAPFPELQVKHSHLLELAPLGQTI